MGPHTELLPEFEDIATGDSQFAKVRKNPVRDRLNNKQLKIGGNKFKIGFKGRLTERFQIAAQTDFFNGTMLFETNQTEGQLLSAILHELLEVLNRKYALGLEHSTIYSLENALFDTFADNPILLDELIRYARKLSK